MINLSKIADTVNNLPTPANYARRNDIAPAPAFSVIALCHSDPTNKGIRRIDAANAATAKSIAQHPSLSAYDDIVIRENASGRYLAADTLNTNWANTASKP